MSNELLPCPFCGATVGNAMAIWEIRGEGWRVGCVNEECGMAKIITHPCPTRAEAIAAWNRRFVCLDKNGDKVYSDSTIIGVRGDHEVDECHVCYESFQWWAVEAQATYGVRQSYALSSFDEIELIESESDK